jgi:hypothetical protein
VKAVEDAGAIRTDLKSHGFDWLHGKDLVSDYCSLYFGGGLGGLVTADTTLQVDGKNRSFGAVAKPAGNANAAEKVFLIPAQRVLVLQDGWPRPFMSYSAGDPYCIRHFSDSLRMLMEGGLGSKGAVFPQTKQLKAELKALVNDSIYVGAKLKLETEGMRKRIVLSQDDNQPALPYSAWSAGQREFTPLLLGLYRLMPSAKVSTRGDLELVIVEEPEMGLHPQAIVSFGLLVLELLHRGYRVIVSTHSPVILDLVWALRELKELMPKAATQALKKVFGLPSVTAQVQAIFSSALTKEYRTYYFDRTAKGTIARDISTLDPGSDDAMIAGWGGLSGFSGSIADTVGDAMLEGGK